MDEIELGARGKRIKLIVHEGEWCEVYWGDDTQMIRLGADKLLIIISKLLIAFNSIENRDYFLNSEMFGVMALMDPLTTIAGRDLDNSELELICIEYGGNVLPLVVLSDDDKIRWIKQLKDSMLLYS